MMVSIHQEREGSWEYLSPKTSSIATHERKSVKPYWTIHEYEFFFPFILAFPFLFFKKKSLLLHSIIFHPLYDRYANNALAFFIYYSRKVHASGYLR